MKMSRLYDTIEPSVVDEELLKKAVEEQGPKDQAGRIAKEEGIHFRDVTHLRLDFKNILKIDNLWQFTALTKLQLDNNIIERIQGLDSLTNLVWLDLSFNNIEVIEGLDALVKLEDLSLYNNRISEIANIDTLCNLQVLSIGNNSLDQLENLVYLRRFKRLRSLNLAGNPICEDENYKMFIAAYLPELVYLDFRLVDENTREVASLQYQYAIDEIKHNENMAQRKLTEELQKQEELELHKAAYVEFLNGSFLFDSMYSEDPETAKLAYLPGMHLLLESYKSKFVAICQQIFENGLKQHVKREAEVATFFECLREATESNQEKGSEKVAGFEERKREIFSELHQLTDMSLLETRIAQYNKEINELCDSLMMLELQLLDQLEDIIKDFERNISDMMTGFIEFVQGMISQCRDLENNHHEKLQEIAINMLEKVLKNEFVEDIPDEVRMLFVDKDTVVNIVSASHDIHLLKIDNREDDLITRANEWTTSLVEKVHSDEVKRNRKRILEINIYIDYLRDEIENLDLPDSV
ncbi:dynein regulatory complex subunit 3 [Polyodon spathula]|uniref:dynein regulatory complex subunit 3 n=1 Tax=Polyodon spathula TaxID=7913 RepID=UPI001B7E30FD|nr:dynein regulatory complex subunit 3 [Polyodon spathula]